MGYTAFDIELDEDGYPEWHRNRKLETTDNPATIHSLPEYAAAYRVFQPLHMAAVAGMLTPHDSRQMRLLGMRISAYRRNNNIKPVVYQQVK